MQGAEVRAFPLHIVQLEMAERAVVNHPRVFGVDAPAHFNLVVCSANGTVQFEAAFVAFFVLQVLHRPGALLARARHLVGTPQI